MAKYTVIPHGAFWHVLKDGVLVCAHIDEQSARQTALKLNAAKSNANLAKTQMKTDSTK